MWGGGGGGGGGRGGRGVDEHDDSPSHNDTNRHTIFTVYSPRQMASSIFDPNKKIKQKSQYAIIIT